MMPKLSKEQRRKIGERLEWLRGDEQFNSSLHALISTDAGLGALLHDIPNVTHPSEQALVDFVSSLSYAAVEIALHRFEGEKVAITGRGRYAEQVDALAAGVDTFFGPYDAEVRQIGVSVFRFLHAVLADAVGDDVAFREFAINLTKVVQPLRALLDVVKLIVIEAKMAQESRNA